MPKDFEIKFLRVMDANYNRAKEGLRVCEDVCRYCFDDHKLTKSAKVLRHELTSLLKPLGLTTLLVGRDIEGDVGQQTIKEEKLRNGLEDIFYANIQRVKESLRVLEEFVKLKNSKQAQGLKALRYRVYTFEKQVLVKLTK